jgi:hypothetical protein
MFPVGRLLGIYRATPSVETPSTTHLLPQHSLAAQGLIWSSTVGVLLGMQTALYYWLLTGGAARTY